MKKLLFALLLVGTTVTVFTACKKDKTAPDLTATAKTQADDNARVSKELDDMNNDVNNSVSSAHSMSGGRVDDVLPCDATIAYDTLGVNRTVTITYNGTSCDGLRTRTGVVTVSIPVGSHWIQAGSVITIGVNNLHVTRLSDNKSITINGTITVTNVTGGLVAWLASLGDIKHHIQSSNMTVTFDDGSHSTWNVDKQHEFTYSNGINAAVTGLHTNGGTADIAEWGIARDGSNFQVVIDQPLTLRQDCNFRLTSGKETVKNTTTNQQLSITFGLDVQGNAASCPGLFSPYYMKIAWNDAQGNPHSVIYPYW